MDSSLFGVMAALVGLENELRALDNSCSILYRDGDYEKCVEVLRESLKLRRGALDPNNKDVLLNLNNLAAALGRAGYLVEAEEAFREVLSKRRAAFGDSHVETATTMMHLGVVLKNRGNFEESEQILHDSLCICIGLLGAYHLASAEAAYAYAVLSTQSSRVSKSHFLFKLAEAGLKSSLGDDHPHTRECSWLRARTLQLATNYGNDPNQLQQQPQLTEDNLARIAKILPSRDTMNTWESASSSSSSSSSSSFWRKEMACEVCSCEFTLTFREHHCRTCCRAVCDSCSNSTAFFRGVASGSSSSSSNSSSSSKGGGGSAPKPKRERCCNVCAAAGFSGAN